LLTGVQVSPGARQRPQAQRDCRGDAPRVSAVSLPARPVWRPACPGPGWIRLALPAGRPPGGRSEGAGHRAGPPARRDRSRQTRQVSGWPGAGRRSGRPWLRL